MNPPSILPTLTAAANQILATVAPNTFRLTPIQVSVSEETGTAATDGQLHIRMPRTFCGVALAQEPVLALGLLVHEVSHFLQPLAQVVAAEERAGIPRWLANLALDIQGESLLVALFPAFAPPLRAPRQMVHDRHLADYRRALVRAKSFAQAAGPLALWGRFVEPCQPFTLASAPGGTPDRKRARAFLARLDRFRVCSTGALPEELVALVQAFPELQSAPTPALPAGLARRPAPLQGRLAAALGREARATARGLAGDGVEPGLEQHQLAPNPPLAQAQALSRRLAGRFRARRGGIQICAPGEFQRRAALREEVPLRMALPGREHPAPRLVLCLDASSSMRQRPPGGERASKWRLAQVAAQALALAVTGAGGQVVGVVFAERAWLSRREDMTPLTLGRSVHAGLVGNGTRFHFLAELWRRYPDHRVLVVTDGDGPPPSAVLPRDRARTQALLIPKGDAQAAQTWSRRQVTLTELRHLAQVMALLVPGRWSA